MNHVYNFFHKIMWCLFYFLGGAGLIAHLENVQATHATRQVSLDVAILAVAGVALLLIIKNFCLAFAGAPKPKQTALAVVRA